MEDNIDHTFMQRQTIRDVEKIFADMSENAKRNGYPDPVVIPTTITFSYEELASKQKEFGDLCDSIFGELIFAPPHRPNPRLVLTNDAPIETDKPKATLVAIK